MGKILIRDYVDDFWGDIYCIGMGTNHSSFIVPQIEAMVDAGEKEIEVLINTIGGSVYCSLSITNALQKAKESGVKIITVNEGICASAGTQIFMIGDERISYTSLFMIHNPAQFIFGYMEAADMEREKNALHICKDTILITYAATGLDEPTLRAMLDAETWLTPSLCVQLGFATEDRSDPTKKADVLEQSVKGLEKASPENRIYASKFFNTIKTKNTNMDNVKELLEKQNKAVEQSNSLMSFFKNKFANIFKNEGEEETIEESVNASVQLEDESYIYFEGELAVGTKVFTDEEMTIAAEDGDHTLMDGRTITVAEGAVSNIQDVVEDAVTDEALIAENNSLKEQLATANKNIETLTNSVNASNEMLTKLKNVKSTFEPAPREQEINPKPNNSKEKADLSTEAREARKQEIKDKKNKK